MTLPTQSQSACPRCRAQVSATARFCRACGQALTAEARRFCPECGQPAAPASRFCRECGRDLSATPPAIASIPPPIRATRPVPGPPPPPAARTSSKRRGPLLWLAACGALVVIGVITAGGYLGYRYWSSLPSSQESSTGGGGQEVDAEWGSADLTPPDLAQAQTQIDPHVARLAEAVRNGNLEQAVSMTLPETREALKTAFEAHPDRLERFGRLLATRRLTAFEDDLAEFEVAEDGRVFVVTFQRAGNTWALHSF